MGGKKRCRKPVASQATVKSPRGAQSTDRHSSLLSSEIEERPEVTDNFLPNTTENGNLEESQCAQVDHVDQVTQNENNTFEEAVINAMVHTVTPSTTAEQIVAFSGRKENLSAETELQTTRGQKRTFQHFLDSNEDAQHERTRVLQDSVNELKKRCANLESRLEKLEQERSSQKEDLRDAQCLTDSSNSLTTTKVIPSLAHNKDMTESLEQLGIDERLFIELKKKTTTSTARSYLKHLYPNPPADFQLSDVKKEIVDAIIECAKVLHPYETARSQEIRAAMRNYFAFARHKRKLTKTRRR